MHLYLTAKRIVKHDPTAGVADCGSEDSPALRRLSRLVSHLGFTMRLRGLLSPMDDRLSAARRSVFLIPCEHLLHIPLDARTVTRKTGRLACWTS